MKKRIKCLMLCLVLGFSLITAPVFANKIFVTKSEFGNKWPFTVDKGFVECRDDAIIFYANDKAYAVNGTASRLGYATINEIWKDDLETLKMLKEAFPNETGIRTPKMSIGPIMDICN